MSKTTVYIHVHVHTKTYKCSPNISLGSDALTTELILTLDVYPILNQYYIHLQVSDSFNENDHFPIFMGIEKALEEIIIIQNDIISTLIITLFISLKTDTKNNG